MSKPTAQQGAILFAYKSQGLRIDQSAESVYGFQHHDTAMEHVDQIIAEHGLPLCIVSAPNRKSAQCAVWIRQKLQQVFQHTPAFAIDLDLADYYADKQSFKSQSQFTIDLLDKHVTYSEQDYMDMLNRAYDRYALPTDALIERLTEDKRVTIDGDLKDHDLENQRYILVILSLDMIKHWSLMHGERQHSNRVASIPERGVYWINWYQAVTRIKSSQEDQDKSKSRVTLKKTSIPFAQLDPMADAFGDVWSGGHQNQEPSSSSSMRAVESSKFDQRNQSRHYARSDNHGESSSYSSSSDTSYSSSSNEDSSSSSDRRQASKMTHDYQGSYSQRASKSTRGRGSKPRPAKLELKPRNKAAVTTTRKNNHRSLISELAAPVDL